MHWVDYLVFAVMTLSSLGVGVYYAVIGRNKKETVSSYFSGNHHLALIPTTMSLFASLFSAIALIGIPAEIYVGGLKILAMFIGCFCALVVVCFTFVPLMYRLQLVSVFEYLERRYNSRTLRTVTMFLSLTSGIFYAGVATYTPCHVLEGVSGIPVEISIVATCLVASFYTTLGGIKAVVWVDLAQGVIMFVGMLVITGVAISSVDGGITEAFRIMDETGRVNIFDTTSDIFQPYTFWILVIGGTINWIKLMGTLQFSVQRYCAMETVTKARLAVVLLGPQVLFLYAIIGVMSTCIFAHYYQTGCDPLASGIIESNNLIVPHFVQDYFPVTGMLGLLLSTLFSGALSSLSTTYNSSAAIIWEEIKDVVLRHLPEKYTGLLIKSLSALLAVLSIAVSYVFVFIKGSVIKMTFSVVGLFASTSFAIYITAALCPFTTAWGGIISQFCGLAFAGWLTIGQNVYNLSEKYDLPFVTYNCSLPNNYNSSLASSTFSLSNISNTDMFLQCDTGYVPVTIGNVSICDTETGLPIYLQNLYSLSFMLIPLTGSLVTLLVTIVISPIFGCGKGTNKSKIYFISDCLGTDEEFLGYKYSKDYIMDEAVLGAHLIANDVENAERPESYITTGA